jgi:hypothetical protein
MVEKEDQVLLGEFGVGGGTELSLNVGAIVSRGCEKEGSKKVNISDYDFNVEKKFYLQQKKNGSGVEIQEGLEGEEKAREVQGNERKVSKYRKMQEKIQRHHQGGALEGDGGDKYGGVYGLVTEQSCENGQELLSSERGILGQKKGARVNSCGSEETLIVNNGKCMAENEVLHTEPDVSAMKKIVKFNRADTEEGLSRGEPRLRINSPLHGKKIQFKDAFLFSENSANFSPPRQDATPRSHKAKSRPLHKGRQQQPTKDRNRVGMDNFLRKPEWDFELKRTLEDGGKTILPEKLVVFEPNRDLLSTIDSWLLHDTPNINFFASHYSTIEEVDQLVMETYKERARFIKVLSHIDKFLSKARHEFCEKQRSRVADMKTEFFTQDSFYGRPSGGTGYSKFVRAQARMWNEGPKYSKPKGRTVSPRYRNFNPRLVTNFHSATQDQFPTDSNNSHIMPQGSSKHPLVNSLTFFNFMKNKLERCQSEENMYKIGDSRKYVPIHPETFKTEIDASYLKKSMDNFYN